MLNLRKVNYKRLPAKFQESYNFQKASAILADYGFITNQLKFDWQGADFLAQHIDGIWIKVQLKGRLQIDVKYEGKDIYIMFEDKKNDNWYLFPHDDFLNYVREYKPNSSMARNGYSRKNLSNWELTWLENYKILK